MPNNNLDTLRNHEHQIQMLMRDIQRVSDFFAEKNDIGDLQYRDEHEEFGVPQAIPQDRLFTKRQAIDTLTSIYEDFIFIEIGCLCVKYDDTIPVKKRDVLRLIAFINGKNDIGNLRYRDENGEFETPRDTPRNSHLTAEEAIEMLYYMHFEHAMQLSALQSEIKKSQKESVINS